MVGSGTGENETLSKLPEIAGEVAMPGNSIGTEITSEAYRPNPNPVPESVTGCCVVNAVNWGAAGSGSVVAQNLSPNVSPVAEA